MHSQQPGVCVHKSRTGQALCQLVSSVWGRRGYDRVEVSVNQSGKGCDHNDDQMIM